MDRTQAKHLSDVAIDEKSYQVYLDYWFFFAFMKTDQSLLYYVLHSG